MVKIAKQLLFAPLDWGLGHTTRCIPIIRYLCSLGHHVTFAGNQAQCAFIRKNITVDTIALEGYNITYSKTGNTFSFKLLLQLPKILRAVQREHNWLKKLLIIRNFDGIITDNRYGLYTDAIPTVIITHQLRIHTGWGRWADDLLQQAHYKFLNHYKEKWVVDNAGTLNLAGSLSHPSTLPVNTHYIGLLSQLESTNEIMPATDTLLILLSGPEPQRTILADILWQQAANHNGHVIFIEGNPGSRRENIPSHITWYAQAEHTTVQAAMQRAGIVVCRSGYSTIMDLVLLQKKAILIPTPGQAEQEYLATYLREKNFFYSTVQKDFNLPDALKKSVHFPFHHYNMNENFTNFKIIVDQWLLRI